MHGSGSLLSISVVALAHTVCSPRVFAASLIPSRETPSVVANKVSTESPPYTLCLNIYISFASKLRHIAWSHVAYKTEDSFLNI